MVISVKLQKSKTNARFSGESLVFETGKVLYQIPGYTARYLVTEFATVFLD